MTGDEDHFPLTTREGWQRFADTEPDEPKLLASSDLELLDDADRMAYDHARADYHSRLIVVATPTIRQVYATGRRLVLLNRHQVSARRGLIVTGAAGLLTELARDW